MATASIVNVVFYGYRNSGRELFPKHHLILGVDDINLN
jgi:hypothetical protein